VKDQLFIEYSGLRLSKFSPWTEDFNKVIGAMRAGQKYCSSFKVYVSYEVHIMQSDIPPIIKANKNLFLRWTDFPLFP